MKQVLNGTIDTQKTSYSPIGTVNVNDEVIINLNITMDGKKLELIDPVIKIIYKKMDNNKVEQESGIILEEDKVVITPVIQALTCPGMTTAQLIINHEGRISTSVFHFNVAKTIEGEIIESKSEIKTLDELDAYLIKANTELDVYTQKVRDLVSEVENITETEAERVESEKTRNSRELVRVDNEKDRKTSEIERAENEIVRNETEEDRVTNEKNRKLAENTRKTNEAARVVAEESRNNTFEENESIRNEQEKKRVRNEVSRESDFKAWTLKEDDRKSNEETRKTNEEARKKEELKRIEAEKVRQAQEDNREKTYTNFNEAEVDRKSNEETRKRNEETRINAENTRDTRYEERELERDNVYKLSEKNRDNLYNSKEKSRDDVFTFSESERDKAEALRKARETEREKAELERGKAEVKRNDDESIRVTAETKRDEDEAIRVENEKGRVAAEIEREKTLNDHIENHPSGVTPEQEKEIAKIPELESQLTDIEIETEEARTTMEGEICDKLDHRLVKDFTKVKEDIMQNVSYVDGTEVFDRTVIGELKDVVIGGNTYHNLWSNSFAKNMTVSVINDCIRAECNNYYYRSIHLGKNLAHDVSDLKLKKNTLYTFITKQTIIQNQTNEGISCNIITYKQDGTIVKQKYKGNLVSEPMLIATSTNHTTGTIIEKSLIEFVEDFEKIEFRFCRSGGNTNPQKITDTQIMIFEGDYTNKSIPPYFEGIESTGEREKVGDKYQVSVKVIGKNLFDTNELKKFPIKNYELQTKDNRNCFCPKLYGDYHLKFKAFENIFKPNTQYTLSYDYYYEPQGTTTGGLYMLMEYTDGTLQQYGASVINQWTKVTSTSTVGKTVKSIKFTYGTGSTKTWWDLDAMQLEEGITNTPVEPYKEQSKTVLINQPLRQMTSVSGIVAKDLMYADKGYVDRSMVKMDCFGLSEGYLNILQAGSWTDDMASFYIRADSFGFEPYPSVAFAFRSCVCNVLPFMNDVTTDKTKEGVACVNASPNYLGFNIKKSRLTTHDIAGFKKFLDDNKVFVIGARKSPIKEPIQKITLKSNDGKTYIGTTNYIKPVVTAKALTNVAALLSGLRYENENLKSDNEILRITNELLVEGHKVQEVKITDTEDAVNFLLMNGMSTFKNTQEKSEVKNMASYLAKQIYQGRLSYEEVIAKYPQFKAEIDDLLKAYVENDGIIYK